MASHALACHGKAHHHRKEAFANAVTPAGEMWMYWVAHRTFQLILLVFSRHVPMLAVLLRKTKCSRRVWTRWLRVQACGSYQGLKTIGDVFIVFQFRVIFRSQFSNVFFPFWLRWIEATGRKAVSQAAELRDETNEKRQDSTERFIWDLWDLGQCGTNENWSTWTPRDKCIPIWQDMTRPRRHQKPQGVNMKCGSALRNDRTMIGTQNNANMLATVSVHIVLESRTTPKPPGLELREAHFRCHAMPCQVGSWWLM